VEKKAWPPKQVHCGSMKYMNFQAMATKKYMGDPCKKKIIVTKIDIVDLCFNVHEENN